MQNKSFGQREFSTRDSLSYALIYIKHARLAILLFLLGLITGLIYYVYAPSVYQARGAIRYQILNLPLHSSQYDPRRVLNALRSRYMVERTALAMGLTDQLGNYETIRDKYVPKVEVKLSDVSTLSVDVFAYDPKIAQAWPAAMAEEFINYQEALSRERRERSRERYQEEMQSLAGKIEEGREDRAAFEQENEIMELFIQQSGLTQVPKDMILTRHRIEQLQRASQTLASSTVSTVEKLSMLSSMNAQAELGIGPFMARPGTGPQANSFEDLVPIPQEPVGSTVVIPSMVTSLEPWQELEAEYRRLQQEVREAEKKFLPGHRIMAGLNEKLSRVESDLELELGVMSNRFTLELERLQETLAILEQQIPDYREVNRKYRAFREQYAMNQSSQLAWGAAYDEIAKDLTRAEYSGDEQPISMEFLGMTLVREDPVSPAKAKLAVIALALGIGLALGVPFAMEKLNDTGTKLDDLEKYLQLTGLGVIPAFAPKALENIVRSSELDSRVPDQMQENFRIIRSGIAFNQMDIGPTQAIMVTSARPREGKSTVALNLAWAFASMGEKTLLVDCDLRRGRVHGMVNLDNKIGLTTALLRRISYDDATQQDVIENLDIITRGPVYPGTTEILCQPEFANIMDVWRQKYQRIILDTPPVLGLSEPVSLQRVVDGVVLVMLSERTLRRDTKDALEMLRKSGAKVYGFVLNRLDLNKVMNHYNYYYYSPYYYSSLEEAPEPAEPTEPIGKA